jgi:branched-subunit amino acid aminotransferase/4-amino-4-deoxychorismate lyase
MNELQHILYNNNWYNNQETFLPHTNRGFRFGDAIFETMHTCGTEIQFFDAHWERICNAMSVLKMTFPQGMDAAFLKKKCTQLLTKNKIFGGGRVRLTLFRSGAGLYAPETNIVSWILESIALEHKEYTLNEKGITIDIYHEIKRQSSIFSVYKTTNALSLVMAAIYKTEMNLDDCLLLSEQGNLSEAISSNLFLVSGKNIATPPLSDGCVSGTMRSHIIRIAQKNGFHVLTNKSIKPEELLRVEEVFLSNAIAGIRWVGAYNNKRYYNNVARQIIRLINEEAGLSS